MKFVLDGDQRLFAETLDKLLTEADTPAVIRRWAAGDSEPGRRLWATVAEAGVFALAVPEAYDGAGPLPVELVTALYELGRHGMPGPIVETVAATALLSRLADEESREPSVGITPAGETAAVGLAGEWLPRIAAGEAVVSLAMPYALDAGAADLVLVVDGDRLCAAVAEGPLESLDPARRLTRVRPGEPLASGPAVAEAAAVAYDVGVLACAAQHLGAGRRLLETSVAYAKTRRQFGRAIGEFQAVKHHLANALVGLEFARPLLYGAALAWDSDSFRREVSAAKAAAADAACEAARTALQVHGAIGYTAEYDPSLLLRKVRALRSCWGTPAAHRARVLTELTSSPETLPHQRDC